MKEINQKAVAARRQFLTTVVGAAALPSIGLAWSSVAHGQSTQPYKLIEPVMPTQDESSVEVLEFFWFGCPHCYAFEPAINEWNDSKQDYVKFVREAPPLNPSWEQHSRSFYAAQALGIDDGMFDNMFDEIHKKKKPMRNPKKIAQFIESLAEQAGITAVPSVVINGKYLTGNTLAGSHQGVIDVINELTAQEHEAA